MPQAYLTMFTKVNKLAQKRQFFHCEILYYGIESYYRRD